MKSYVEVEHEIDVVVEVEHRGAVGHRDEAHHSWPEPLKCWYQQLSGMAKIEPAFHSKVMRAPALFHTVVEPRPVEDHDHLLEQMMPRLQLLAGRDLADVAIVGSARGLVVDEHALGRPRLAQGFRSTVRRFGHVLRADDVEPVVAHEAQIGRFLLGLELFRQFLRNEHVLGHEFLLRLGRRCPSGGPLFSGLQWFSSLTGPAAMLSRPTREARMRSRHFDRVTQPPLLARRGFWNGGLDVLKRTGCGFAPSGRKS